MIVHTSADYADVRITSKAVGRPGLQYAGFFEYFDNRRMTDLTQESGPQTYADGQFVTLAGVIESAKTKTTRTNTLMDDVREIVSPTGIHASVSIGIGRDGKNFEECYNFAQLSTEMALSRGGDQTVIKNRFNFEFFGGRGGEVEKRTKVKSRVMAAAKEKGLVRSEGKEYVMQDGDVTLFRFNV